MLELRAGRTSEYADQEKQANENVAKKAARLRLTSAKRVMYLSVVLIWTTVSVH